MEYNTETERKILQAASDIFLEKGHAGARMQEIADKAGINKAMLHYYFRSKEKLFKIVFKIELKATLNKIFSSLSPSDTFKEFIENFVRIYLTNIAGKQNIMRFILWEINKSAFELVESFHEVFEAQGFEGNPILNRVNRAIEEGEIRPVNAENFVLSLMGMCVFPFIAAPIVENLIPGLNLNDPDFISTRTKAITDLIWNGIRV